MIKLDFTKTRDYSDATAYYEVKCAEDFTVYEFLTEYLPKQKEWGYVNINELFLCHKELKLLEYSYDKIGNLNFSLFEKVKNKTVNRIEATGGWGLMDYALHVDYDDPELLEEGENDD